jgi:hypothetical protein
MTSGLKIGRQPEHHQTKGIRMQVFCKPVDSTPDVHCPVCGQGFLRYWERSCRIQQADTRDSIQEALRDHHLDATDTSAHPESAFNIPKWSGLPQFSAAALLGGAPL